MLDAVRRHGPRRKLSAIPQTLQVAKPVNPPPTNCRRCGRGAHSHQSCPAKDALCYRCNKKGHYSSQCLSNTIFAVATTQPEQSLSKPIHLNDQHTDIAFLVTVLSIQGISALSWCCTHQLLNTLFEMYLV